MKNLKKLLAVLMTGLMILFVAGCGRKQLWRLWFRFWLGQQCTIERQEGWRSDADTVIAALDPGWCQYEAKA